MENSDVFYYGYQRPYSDKHCSTTNVKIDLVKTPLLLVCAL